jgi:hypothetical protein
MHAVYCGTDDERSTFVDDYHYKHGAVGEVRVNTGAWNTGWHNGHGFLQGIGSKRQRDALALLPEIIIAVHEARWQAGERHEANPEVWDKLEDTI